MSLATMTAAPSFITLGDRRYKVGPLSYLSLGVLQRYLNDTHEKPPVIGRDTNWPSVLFSSVFGVETFINVLFSASQTLQDDDMAHILGHVNAKNLGVLFRLAMDSDDEEGTGPDPKAASEPSIG